MVILSNSTQIRYSINDLDEAVKGSISNEKLEKLLNTDYCEIKTYIAEKTYCPEILAELSKDDDFVVRINVALNPYISKSTLKKLACDKDPVIREMVLKNTNSDREIKETVRQTNQLYKYMG